VALLRLPANDPSLAGELFEVRDLMSGRRLDGREDGLWRRPDLVLLTAELDRHDVMLLRVRSVA
jgi:hypothetical protein